MVVRVLKLLLQANYFVALFCPAFLYNNKYKNDIDFGQVQVMEFPWHLLKDDGILTGFSLVFDQTVVKKT